MFTVRRLVFCICGSSLQCHRFVAVRAKAVTLCFLAQESLQNLLICDFWFLLLFYLFINLIGN